jgi:NIMA (never in mitosis gene a)-related kinase
MEGMTKEEEYKAVQEASILKVLEHPNIVKLREVFKTKSNNLCIAMEYCDGGDLRSKIKEFKVKREFIPESTVISYFT